MSGAQKRFNFPSQERKIVNRFCVVSRKGVLITTMYDLYKKAVIQQLLEQHGAAPLHQLGQHFLTDVTIVDNMVKFAEIAPDDILVEIGTGLGTVTRGLANKAKKVIGIEIDKAMAAITKAVLEDADLDDFEIVNKNILSVEVSGLVPKIFDYTLVSSLPYYLTSPILKKLLIEEEKPPRRLVVLMQKEVAQRMTAVPPNMNFLAVMMQLTSTIEVKRDVAPHSFWPQPDVQSSLVVITPSGEFSELDRTIISYAHAAFQQKRKQLLPTLAKYLERPKEELAAAFATAELDPTIRPENLTVDQWRSLVKEIDHG